MQGHVPTNLKVFSRFRRDIPRWHSAGRAAFVHALRPTGGAAPAAPL